MFVNILVTIEEYNIDRTKGKDTQENRKGNTMRTVLRIKEWFEEKEQNKASAYNIYFQIADRNEDGSIKREDGFVSLVCEILAESEKAVKVHIESGDVVGSAKGWTTWVPKSVVAEF